MIAVRWRKHLKRQNTRYNLGARDQIPTSQRLLFLSPATQRHALAAAATELFSNNIGEFQPQALRLAPAQTHETNRKLSLETKPVMTAIHGRYFSYFESLFLQKYFFYITADPSKAAITFTHNRASFVPELFRYKTGRVYRGRGWKTVRFTRWRCGFRLGEFARSRKRAVFRAKTMKKKSKSRRIAAIHALKIKKIKALKSGKTKKNRLISRSGEVYL